MALMLRLSWWQWHRHLEKQELIKVLDARLAEEPSPVSKVLERNAPLSDLVHARVRVEGEYDFAHEVVLRNRRYDGMAGVHVLTPLKIPGEERRLLVSRGFLPLLDSEREVRVKYHTPPHVAFVGLIKEPLTAHLFAPKDPEPLMGKWVDAWLRPDILKIQKQLPYPLLPFYVELMDEEDIGKVREKILTSSSDKEELLSLTTRKVSATPDYTKYSFPISVYDVIVPPGKHLGYVYEWAFMALMTGLICLVLQLRPRRNSIGAS